MNISPARLLFILLLLPLLVTIDNLNLQENNRNYSSKPTAPKLEKKATKLKQCQTACLRLIKDKTQRKNSLGNPIYILEAYQKGQKIYAFDAVTGRKNTQTRNRDRSGTEAPLPSGKYSIGRKIIAGTSSEIGATFIPIYPEFSTGRTHLGIHYDPSFNKKNGKDGTAGCIALTNKSDRDLINQFVKQYQPKKLIVLID